MGRLRRLVHEVQYRTQWKKYAMTISDAHRYVWFRIAKCGTTTIRAMLENVEDGLLTPSAAPFSRFDASKYRGYFKFAFVRNPYDRLVSCYFGKVRGSDRNRLHVRSWSPDLTFAGFVDAVCRTPDSRSNRHYRSQHTLCDLASLDFLGRLENLENDISEVMERLTVHREVRVPSLNTTDRSHYSRYYDDDLRTQVADRYAEDLRLFGYDFDGPWSEGSGPGLSQGL
jgi:hypothetical protein